MKKVTLRMFIATALSISFLIYSPLRLSSARSLHPAIDQKSESQLRTEASRYDSAIRAIGGIATMKLESGEDLKEALAILDRERSNLKFHRSKFIVLGLSDSTFVGAAKKRTPDKQAAEAFAKELNADPKAVLKLNGAESLKTRIQQGAEADAAVLRRVGERLKEAAEKIKKTSQGSADPRVGTTDKVKVIKAGFSETARPIFAPDTRVISAQVEGIATAIVILYAVVFYAALFEWAFGPLIEQLLKNDKVAECQERADDSYLKCESAANKLIFPANIAAGAACYGQWLLDQAACLRLYA